MQANFNFCHFSIGGNQQHPLDIYNTSMVPNMQSNMLGEIVSATIGGMEHENGGNVVPLGGVRMDWPYEGPVPSDFHLDENNWDTK